MNTECSATNFMNKSKYSRNNDNKDITCWTCGKKGHIPPNFPNKKNNNSNSNSDDTNKNGN